MGIIRVRRLVCIIKSVMYVVGSNSRPMLNGILKHGTKTSRRNYLITASDVIIRAENIPTP